MSTDDTHLDRVWLTPTEAHIRTGYSLTRVKAALQTGELKGYQHRKGHAWRIHRDDVDAWVRGESRAPA